MLPSGAMEVLTRELWWTWVAPTVVLGSLVGLSGAVILGLECGGETQAFNVGALHIAQRG